MPLTSAKSLLSIFPFQKPEIEQFISIIIMLKFTAQLSEQFRRASSLCTLKSYHISKQFKNYDATHQFVQHYSQTNQKLLHAHPNFEGGNTYHERTYQPCKQNTNYHPDQYYSSAKLSKTYNYLKDQPQPRRQNILERNFHSHRAASLNPGRHNCHINIKCCHEPHNNRGNMSPWKTPSRSEQNRMKILQSKKSEGQMNTHASTNINENSEAGRQLKDSISEINLNMIYLPSKEEKNQKYRLRQNIGNNGLENSIPRVSKLHEKSAQAAKLRISSINNLQNIHKRIQATIGFNNSLKN